MYMNLERIELILEKKLFFNFLGNDFLAPKSAHGREKQPLLGPACSRKKAVRILGSTRPLVLQKNNCSENFSKHSSKTSMVESFLNTLANPS